MKESYEQLYAHEFNNLDEIEQFLESRKLPNLTKEIGNMVFPLSNR